MQSLRDWFQRFMKDGKGNPKYKMFKEISIITEKVEHNDHNNITYECDMGHSSGICHKNKHRNYITCNPFSFGIDNLNDEKGNPKGSNVYRKNRNDIIDPGGVVCICRDSF
jgi:hypothetical protein